MNSKVKVVSWWAVNSILMFVAGFFFCYNKTNAVENEKGKTYALESFNRNLVYSTPIEIDKISEVPEEFYKHEYFEIERMSDKKIIFSSVRPLDNNLIFLNQLGKALINRDEDVFFLFACDKQLAQQIVQKHKASGGSGCMD